MITYPKEIIHNRWDSMPQGLREAMFSPAYGVTVLEIAGNYHLSDTKSETLMKLVGYVLFGLIHPEELDKKITKELGIDKKIAKELAEEIDRKFFSQFKKEISNLYSPVPESSPELSEEYQTRKERNEESSINIEGASGTIKIGDTRNDSKDKKIEISKEKPKKDDAPFILSQDKESKETEEEVQRKNVEKRKKSFSFATDGFFSSKKEEKESPKADVQAPGNKDSSGGGFFGFGNKKKKEKQEKIVHYSDNRTPLSDDKSDSFINLSNLKPSDSKKTPTENEINKNLNNKGKLNKTENSEGNQEKSFIKRKPPEKNNQAQKNIKKETDVKKQDVKKEKETKNIEKIAKEKSQKKNNDSFLGNISITKSDKKIDEKKKKKNSDGPELDGNTVNLKDK